MTLEHFRPLGGGSSSAPAARTGRVRVHGRAFVDDGGAWNPLGASLFWALWAEANDPDRLARNLAHLAAHGVDYVRILGMVGSASWADRVIGPYGPNYWPTVDALFARLARHGLRAHVTVFADAQVMMPSVADRVLFAGLWGDKAETHAAQIQKIEPANEAEANGIEDMVELRRLARAIRAEWSGPLALSSVTHGHWCEAYAGSVADIATVHHDRDTGKADGMWRPVRQPWGYPSELGSCQFPEAHANSEPIGPDSSVASDDDPLRIALGYATTFVAGGSAYVYHCGAGIRGGGASDLARGRKANIDEYNPAILDALQATKNLLPPGLAGWRRINSHWTDFPFAKAHAAVERGDVMRFYLTTEGNRYVGVVLKVERAFTVEARIAGTWTLHNPLDGSVVTSKTLAAGEPWTLPADLPGYLVIGETR